MFYIVFINKKSVYFFHVLSFPFFLFFLYFFYFYQEFTRSYFISLFYFSFLFYNIKTIKAFPQHNVPLYILRSKTRGGTCTCVVLDRFRFRDAVMGCTVVSVAILSRRQLSADLLKIYLRWIKRADKRGSREQRSRSARPNAPDHDSKAYHSIIESSGTVKTWVFHFWTLHATARGEREREREQSHGCTQTTDPFSFFSMMSLANSKPQVTNR